VYEEICPANGRHKMNRLRANNDFISFVFYARNIRKYFWK
jgi:hypothetical protein